MRKNRMKRRRTANIPLASMGDIAFLLIIFFLLASEFRVDKKLSMELPQSEQVEQKDIDIAARVDIDDQGNIYLDGNLVNDAEEVGVGIGAILQGAVLDSERHVQLRCDATQKKDVFEPVLRAIAEAGGVVEAVGEPE
jgi:biopolymer transport protein ExbD